MWHATRCLYKIPTTATLPAHRLYAQFTLIMLQAVELKLNWLDFESVCESVEIGYTNICILLNALKHIRKWETDNGLNLLSNAIHNWLIIESELKVFKLIG